jgi:protein-L-isoaspartate O-methyltransferase
VNLNYETVRRLKALAAINPSNLEQYLGSALRLLAKWRSTLIANTIVARHGANILSGPFAGMKYLARATEGSLAARLLGTYESELHPAIAEFSASNLDMIIDIGCAEGYYAVGLARLMPHVLMHAYDIDERSRLACAELARRNEVSDRVIIGGEFTPANFADYRGKNVLVMVDAEGAEDELLDPNLAPDLGRMSLIVETHPSHRSNITERLQKRFSATHDIEVIRQRGKGQNIPDWIGATGHLDQLLAVWEWRARPTPWLIMRPKTVARCLRQHP